MREDVIRREVMRLMHSVGYDAVHMPDIRMSESARPDIWCLNPKGLSFVIEVKRMLPKKRTTTDPSLSCMQISNSQRRWLDRHVRGRNGMAYLAIGTVPPAKRRLWIIPWEEWIRVELTVAQQEYGINKLNPDSDFSIYTQHLECMLWDQDKLPKNVEWECEWIPGVDTTFPKSQWRLSEKSQLLVNRNLCPQEIHAGEVDWPQWSFRFPEKKKESK